ncbi:Cysteine rich receptor like kinase, partial [Thalictrum thalictroides]
EETKSSKRQVIIIVVPAVIGVIILTTVNIFFYYFRKNKGFGIVVEGKAWRQWEQGTVLDMIDPTLRECYSISEVRRCIQIGLLCVQEDVAKRPTMASVGLLLSSYSFTLPLPSAPAFFVDTEVILNRIPGEHGTNSDSGSSVPNNSIRSSKNDASITELLPR